MKNISILLFLLISNFVIGMDENNNGYGQLPMMNSSINGFEKVHSNKKGSMARILHNQNEHTLVENSRKNGERNSQPNTVLASYLLQQNTAIEDLKKLFEEQNKILASFNTKFDKYEYDFGNVIRLMLASEFARTNKNKKKEHNNQIQKAWNQEAGNQTLEMFFVSLIAKYLPSKDEEKKLNGKRDISI